MKSLLLAMLVTTPALAVDVNLAWDAVPDARVSEYEIGRGTASGDYTTFQSVAAPLTTATVQGLANGDQWFFAARACGVNHSQCSDWSNEVPLVIPYAAPEHLMIFIMFPAR